MGYSFKRSERVSDLIMQEISRMIINGEIKDPRVDMVSITGVKISDDIGYAKIFFTPLIQNADLKEVLDGFNSAKGFIRSKLSKKLKNKKIPNIDFEYDFSLDKSHKIDDIIRSGLGE